MKSREQMIEDLVKLGKNYKYLGTYILDNGLVGHVFIFHEDQFKELPANIEVVSEGEIKQVTSSGIAGSDAEGQLGKKKRVDVNECDACQQIIHTLSDHKEGCAWKSLFPCDVKKACPECNRINKELASAKIRTFLHHYIPNIHLACVLGDYIEELIWRSRD